MIDRETVDKIFDAIDIVDVVQDFVTLKKRGVNYLGLCPFHNEKTPSFTVSPSKGIFKCFGCGKGGNAVTFIMEHENLSYYEALKFLAKKYHIEIVEKEMTSEDVEKKNQIESSLIVTSYAQKYFTENLLNTDEGKNVGLSYFKERGFREPIINRFQLGFCLNKKDAFTKEAIQKGYNIDFLESTGLTIKKEERVFDRFSDRIIFPIHNLMGRAIAFGGRTLRTDKKIAKYLNSPESEIYHKSKVLYGIFFAKKEISQKNKCYLVEGYTDVLSMHQSGIENVVASSGTSLTTDQIRLIKRFTNNVTIIYDGDSAGVKASLRGIDLVLEQGMNVKILLLPPDEDPDSFAQSHSSSELIEYINKNETDFVIFKTKLLLDDAQNDPVKKANLIRDIVKSISVIPEKITRSVYVKECSSLLDIDEQALYSELNKIIFKKYKSYDKNIKPKEVQTRSPKQNVYSKDNCEVLEREIIKLIINYGNVEMFSDKDDFSEDQTVTVAQYIISEIQHNELDLVNTLYKKIFEEYKSHLIDEISIDSKYFINHPDSAVSNLAADLLSSSYELSRIWEMHDNYVETEEDKLNVIIPEIITSYKNQKIMSALKSTEELLKVAQEENDMEKISELQQRYIALSQFKIALAKNLGERTIL